MGVSSTVPKSVRTLADIFLHRCQQPMEGIAYAFVRDTLELGGELSWSALRNRVAQLSAVLRHRTDPGARILLLYPPGLDIVVAFWACIHAGLVPIPAPPPDSIRRKHSLPRLRAIFDDAQASMILTTGSIQALAFSLLMEPEPEASSWLTTDDLSVGSFVEESPRRSGTSLAYLQYTSGTTATPRGVMISHQNVLAQCEGLQYATSVTAGSRSLCWLPYYHDYGLVHGILAPFYSGISAFLMSPVTFLRRPLRWLEAIDQLGITHSGAPNFAYESCLAALQDRGEWSGKLDRWTVASCGAEPIRAETVEAFSRRFSAYGFDPKAFTPAYGLAESTLVVSAKRSGTEPAVLAVSAEGLANQCVSIVEPSTPAVRQLIGCGEPLPGTTIRIVDPVTNVDSLPDRVGEIWISGQSVAEGYWAKNEESRATFRASVEGDPAGPFLRTGDLGFLYAGQLYVTGRLKDLIILHGRNLYPHDIERTVEQCHVALRAGGGAAFSVDRGQGEELVILHEVDRVNSLDVDGVIEAIRQGVMDEYLASIAVVVLVRTGGLPKTASGKVQRHLAKAAYLEGTLAVVRISGLEVRAPRLSASGVSEQNPQAAGLPHDRLSLEAYLQKVIASMLRTDADQIDRAHPIVTLGVDSLKAGLLKARLEEDFGVDVSFGRLLTGGSIEDLAGYILSGSSITAREQRPVALPLSGSGEGKGALSYALSPSQLRFWFAERLQPQSTVNTIAVAVRLEGHLDADVLESSLQALVDRHEQLRSTFSERHGEPCQFVHHTMSVGLRREDLRHLPVTQRAQALNDLVMRASQHGFDLVKGPLVHALFIRMEPQVATLIVVCHHLIIDGWSMGVLCRELSMIYCATIDGQSIELPKRHGEYHDYVAWHRAWLLAGGRERQLAYWEQQLGNAPLAPALRIDPPKILTTAARTGRVAELLPSDTVARMDDLCRQRGLTRFALLCGLFACVLTRYAGHRDITIGTPVANRHRGMAESLVGCLVNTVALRFMLSEELSVGDLLSYVQCVIAEAIDHQDVPYDEVVRALTARRGGQSVPLFNAMIVFDDQSLDDLRLEGVSASRQSVPPVDLPVDLVLLISQRGDRVKLAIEYRTACYEVNGIGELLKSIHRLLDWCLVHPQERLSVHWNSLTQDSCGVEERTLSTTAIIPQYDSVLDRFHEQVRTMPNACAVVTRQQVLTYEELDRRSNRMARYLREKGVRSGRLVGICCERSVDMAVMLLGVWKAGGAYLPLDPTLPQARLSDMIDESGLSVLVTQLVFRSRLPVFDGIVVDVDLEGAALLACDDAPLSSKVGGEDLAYVMYTSGSMGTPKGVAVTHGNLAQSTRAREVYYGSPVERFLFTSSLAFDSSMIGLYWTWCTGGSLVIPAEDEQGDVDVILELIARHRITHVAWGPAWHVLVIQRMSAAAGASLRTVILGGEVLSADLVRRHYELLPHAVLYNEYGPTEATVWSVVCRTSMHSEGGRVPIGREISGTEVFLFNEQMCPVSTGEIGEIYIGGAGVAQGYWNDPVMTAACFLERSDDKPGRLYKTGDLALWRADGLLEFVGRRDRQIKLRGFRIEPEEIESVLRTLPGVSDAVVLNRESLAGDPALVAYLTPKPGVVLGVGEVRKAMRSRLPSYMLPSSVVVLSTFPRTANGKIDHRALPMPDETSLPQEPVSVAPRDHIEVGLTHMWTQLLGVPIASIHDQFFELGGHSLLATQVASRIREVFGVELPLQTFFDQPTIAALGETIREAQRQDRGQPKLSSIQPVDRSQPLPLSSSQQRMWVLHQLAPQSTAYNMLFVSRQMGPLSRKALRQSVDTLVDRHESFRTTFAMSEKGPIQRVSPGLEVPWGEVDLRRLPLAQRVLEARRLAEAEARRPFNLEAGPLVRFFLIQLDSEDHVLVLTMHHIISDQWSFGVLGHEFASYYNAVVRGQELHMAPLAIQYGDFAAWQQGCLLGNYLSAQEDYWKKQLVGLLPLSLPTDFPRPAEQTFNGAYCSMDMSSSLIKRIEAFSVERNATPFMTLLTCFFILLSRYSGSTDLAVGAPIANRTQAGLEGLIGTFVNTLVLRLDLSGDPTFSECVERVRAIALDAYANQDYSFEKLVENLHVSRDASYGPLVQVLFNMGNAPVGDVDLHGLTWVPFEADTGTAQFDLSMTVETVFSRKAYLTFNTDLFTRATAERMLMHYKVLLHQAVEAPETKCSALRWFTPAEESQVIYGWNKTDEDYPDQDCLFELIESQVERSQQAVALSMDGRTLTYQSLNAKANQLARRLVALGVRRSSTVGLCLERSFDMVIAVLAVWKAGANYLPLDPEYPRDRLRFMLEDSGATLALTTTGLSERVSVIGTRIICLDQEQTVLEQEPTHNLPRVATVDDLAYVLYTSGSTGQPKGVEIRHRSLVNFLCSMRHRPGCTADDVLLAVTTLSFDIAGLELYLPLMVGGRVEIAGRAVAIDGSKLRDRLEESGATLMQATPATWRLLLGAGWAGSRSFTALCGGEAFPPDLAAELLKRTRAVWNMYGPTETTIWSAVSKLEPGDEEISIGRPIANTSMYILDERGAPVAVGVPGELYIGGHGVARGYRNRPDLTAARFLADPFSCERGARMYRTGDRARYRPDGSIVHLGRLDHQVKIRGFRIELGEIEAVLGRHQAVSQVVVTAREDEPGEKYLAAYLVRAEGQSVEVGALRSWTKAVLPEYMLPTAYVFLDAMPLMANNKVDVRALPPPRFRGASVGLEHEGPRDLIEVQLVALWQQVLNVQEIGIHENFFDMGGHSLMAAQLFFLLEQVYGKTLPLATLFHAPTIAELGEVLRREDWTPPWQSLVAIQPNGQAIPCFMVPGVGGNILMFARLARLLGREQPVYGLQIRGVDGKEPPFTVLTEMAAYYVSEVRRVQANGPYRFVGSCTGGVVAYEMAQQLTAQGQTVTLVMLDTWHPKSYARHKSRLWGGVIGAAVIINKFAAAFRGVRGVPLREGWVSLKRKCKAFLVYSLWSIVRREDGRQHPAQQLKAATFGAIARYKVERFPGRIINVVASHRLADEITPDTRYDWPAFGNEESHTILIPAGNAGRLCEPPHVDELAMCIQQVLSRDPGNMLESNLKSKVSDAQ